MTTPSVSTTSYAAVVNNAVITTVEMLPPDIAALTPAEQEAKGWYPITVAPVTFDPSTQYLGSSVYSYSNGVVTQTQQVISQPTELIAAQLAQSKTNLQTQVDGLCASKLAAGLTFNGKAYQTDDQSVSRLQSATIAALAAIQAGGGKAGNLRWADPNTDFVWIATDNTKTSMDAPTLIQLALAAVSYGQRTILFSRTLKDQIVAAADFPTLRGVDITTGWP